MSNSGQSRKCRKYDLQLSRNMHRPALCSSQSLIFTVFLSQIAPKIAWLCQTGAGAGWFKLTFVLRSRKFSGAGAVSPLLLLLLDAGSYIYVCSVKVPLKGRVSQNIFSFVGPVGHNIWWENIRNDSFGPETVQKCKNSSFVGLKIRHSGLGGV